MNTLYADFGIEFMKSFITTYRSFTTPELLLKKIMQRYSVPADSSEPAIPIQLRCSNVVKHWTETNYHDFEEDTIDQLKSFCKELLENPSCKKYASSFATAIINRVGILPFFIISFFY